MTAIGTIAAVLCVVFAWPQSAKLSISNITFTHSGGSARNYWFVCEFDATNEGGRSCEIVGFDILEGNAHIDFGTYIEVGREKRAAIAPTLPVYIGKSCVARVVIIGKVSDPEGSAADLPAQITVQVKVQAKKKVFMLQREVTTLRQTFSNPQ